MKIDDFLYLCTLMETIIFLVRHGETIDNARQVMQVPNGL